MLALPLLGLGKRLGWDPEGLDPLAGVEIEENNHIRLFPIFLNPALNQEVHLIRFH